MQIVTRGRWPNSLAWAVALSLVGYPLVGLLGSLFNLGSALSIAYRLVVVAIGAWALLRLKRRHWTALDLTLVLFFGFYALRLGIDWPSTPGDIEFHVTFLLVACLVPAALISMATQQWHQQQVVLAMLIVGAPAVALAVLVPELSGDDSYYAIGRLSYDKVNPITLGHHALTTLIAAGCYWRFAQGKISKVMLLLVMGMCVWGLVSAGSRGAWVAAFACGAFTLLLRVRNWWLWGPVLIFAIPAGIYVSDPWLKLSDLLDLTRMATIGSDQSSLGRVESYQAAWDTFMANPLFGESYVLPDGYYPHNLIVETGMAMGVIGLVVLAIILARAVWYSIVFMRGRYYLLPLLFVQAVVWQQFSGAIYTAAFLWVTITTLLAQGVWEQSRHRAAYGPLGLGTPMSRPSG